MFASAQPASSPPHVRYASVSGDVTRLCMQQSGTATDARLFVNAMGTCECHGHHLKQMSRSHQPVAGIIPAGKTATCGIGGGRQGRWMRKQGQEGGPAAEGPAKGPPPKALPPRALPLNGLLPQVLHDRSSKRGSAKRGSSKRGSAKRESAKRER